MFYIFYTKADLNFPDVYRIFYISKLYSQIIRYEKITTQHNSTNPRVNYAPDTKPHKIHSTLKPHRFSNAVEPQIGYETTRFFQHKYKSAAPAL